jgi:hypothetical protein
VYEVDEDFGSRVRHSYGCHSSSATLIPPPAPRGS